MLQSYLHLIHWRYNRLNNNENSSAKHCTNIQQQEIHKMQQTSIEIIRNTIEKRIRDSIISRKSFSEYGKSMVTNHADVNNDK